VSEELWRDKKTGAIGYISDIEFMGDRGQVRWPFTLMANEDVWYQADDSDIERVGELDFIVDMMNGPSFPKEYRMQRWGRFEVGKHVELLLGTTYGVPDGARGLVVGISVAGGFHFIHIRIPGVKKPIVQRPSNVRPVNALEELARVELWPTG
jgi:hypothetical protein